MLRPYMEAWRDKMVEIWTDRLDMMGIHDTGALRRSVSSGTFTVGDADADLTFRYLTYGIYVDMGVGKGFYHGNGGYIEVMDDLYRYSQGMKGPKRQPRPWFNVSWHLSVQVLRNKLPELIGDQFSGLFDNLA